MGDKRRKLGTTWEPDLENSYVKLPSVSNFWHLLPYDLRTEWSSILSPDRKWSSRTPENERVGCVAWKWLQHFHHEGLSADVRHHCSFLASFLTRGTVIRDTRSEMRYLVFVPGRFGCQVLRLRSLPLLREGGKDIFEFQLHRPPTFCFPCRFTGINVILCRPLPPSDALVTTSGLSSDRIRLVATGAHIPLLKFTSNTCAPKQISKCLWLCWALISSRHPGAKVLRSVVSSLFSKLQRRRFAGDGSKNVRSANTRRAHRTGMREALLAVDPEEAEHFKVTKESFQHVDIKKKFGVTRLREVVERNFEGDRARTDEVDTVVGS